MQAAARLFPFDYELRFAPSKFCSEVRWKGSAEPCMASLRAELAVNPFAHDLRRNLAGFLIQLDRKPEAAEQVLFIMSVVPHLPPLAIPVNQNPDTM